MMQICPVRPVVKSDLTDHQSRMPVNRGVIQPALLVLVPCSHTAYWSSYPPARFSTEDNFLVYCEVTFLCANYNIGILYSTRYSPVDFADVNQHVEVHFSSRKLRLSASWMCKSEGSDHCLCCTQQIMPRWEKLATRKPHTSFFSFSATDFKRVVEFLWNNPFENV